MGKPGGRNKIHLAMAGKPRPANSGRPRMLGAQLTSFTIRVDLATLVRWQDCARSRGQSTGAMIREALEDFLDEKEWN